ncbi:hypothetical protein VM57_10275 [Stenotrophomonas maltophilia]|uniref:Uncharacterized protein n=1 Tax=Stenotrophomonas maltophilia TaxID=40324 RepID=A0A0F5ZPK6_STEMA|nr:hypothetical protein VM57_10275 [Stenotrophomonas maltophilia]
MRSVHVKRRKFSAEFKRGAVEQASQPVYHRSVVYEDGPIPGMYRFLPLPGVAPDSPEHWWFIGCSMKLGALPPSPLQASRFLKEQSSLEWEDEEHMGP